MADGSLPLVHPVIDRLDLRRKMEATLDKLLAAADAIVRELDRDTPDADLEPSLSTMSGADRSCGDDREADGDRYGATDADKEPSLGSLGGTAVSRGSQRRWSGGGAKDLEHEHDGREPGCEDEGAQCDDEGDRAGANLPFPTYASAHDQRRMVTDYGVCAMSRDGRGDPRVFSPRDCPPKLPYRGNAAAALAAEPS